MLVHMKYASPQIITGAVDSHLNADKYIVPGLGDYGDRFLFTDSLLISIDSRLSAHNYELFGQVLWNQLVKGRLHTTNFQCFEINIFTPDLK